VIPPWWYRLAALLLLLGIVLSPSRAVAATLPMFIAYDMTVPRTAIVGVAAGPSLRPGLGGIPEYDYDDAPDRHDGGTKPRAADATGAAHVYDDTLNLDGWREVGEGVIWDAGAASTAAEGAGPAITRGEQVTEGVIRNAMKDAPLSSQQAGGVSLPRVQQYVDKLLAGEVPPAIKVDGSMIVDGNHRYIAGRILGQEPPVIEWLGGRPGGAIPWSDIKISSDW
jgi:hypothetical protein